MITIELDNARAMAALNRLLRAGVNPAPVLKAIGEDLVESTRQRIHAGGPGPHGEVWERNSPVTMALAAKFNRPKKMGNHPLVDSGILMDTISFRVSGDTLYVGTDRFADEWEGGAAVLHFGTDRAGRDHKVKIPARPFLGVSNDDADEIEATVNEVLSRLVDGKN
ncbi:MAG: phage virion morphogenesis protein [Candidatus Accumulibacter sp.]|jgi:phage virion morphogenesis protein|nr:phage virion morphogenesis protein [Accumulibacter sp.]